MQHSEIMQHSEKGKYVTSVHWLKGWWRPVGVWRTTLWQPLLYAERDLIIHWMKFTRGKWRLPSTGFQSTLSKMIQGYQLGTLPTALHKWKLKIFFLSMWFIQKKILVLSSEGSQEASYCNDQHFSVELSSSTKAVFSKLIWTHWSNFSFTTYSGVWLSKNSNMLH